MQRAVQRDVEAVVRQALGVEPLGAPRLAHHVDHALLEHAGAHPAEDVVAVDPVEDDVVDAGERQQPAEQQARRAGADDGDLGADTRAHRPTTRQCGCSPSRTRYPPATRAAARPRAAEKRPPGGRSAAARARGPGGTVQPARLPARVSFSEPIADPCPSSPARSTVCCSPGPDAATSAHRALETPLIRPNTRP